MVMISRQSKDFNKLYSVAERITASMEAEAERLKQEYIAKAMAELKGATTVGQYVEHLLTLPQDAILMHRDHLDDEMDFVMIEDTHVAVGPFDSEIVEIG
jgi:hypothetical protein